MTGLLCDKCGAPVEHYQTIANLPKSSVGVQVSVIYCDVTTAQDEHSPDLCKTCFVDLVRQGFDLIYEQWQAAALQPEPEPVA